MMANFTIMRNGLNTEIAGDPHIGQSSEDVTVAVKDDGTYSGYAKRLYYSYCYHNELHRALSAVNSNNEFIIPVQAFFEPGMVKLSVELSNGTNCPACNACFLIVTDGAKDVDTSVLPSEKTWQSYIQSYLKSDVDALEKRIDNLILSKADKTALDAKADKTTADALGKRIDNLILHSGTESSAEVIDARTGYDGTAYDTLGTAIRTQIINQEDKLIDCENAIFDKTKEIILENVPHGEFVYGRFSINNTIEVGDNVEINPSETWKYTFVDVKQDCEYEVKFRATSSYTRYVVAVDTENKILAFITTAENVVDNSENILRFTTPMKTSKIIVSSYSLSDVNFYIKKCIYKNRIDAVEDEILTIKNNIGLPYEEDVTMTIKAYGLHELRNVFFEGDIKKGQKIVLDFEEACLVEGDGIFISEDGTESTLQSVVSIKEVGLKSFEFIAPCDFKLIKIYSSVKTENVTIHISIYHIGSIDSKIVALNEAIEETNGNVEVLKERLDTMKPVNSLFLPEFNTQTVDVMKTDCVYNVYGEDTFFVSHKGKIGGKSKKGDKFRFCIMSDIHINECPVELRPEYKDGAWERYYYDKATDSYDYSRVENSFKFVDDKVDLVISLGDTIDRGYGGDIQEAQLKKLNEILYKNLKDTPFLSHRGNHDNRVDRFNDIGCISFGGVNIYFIMADYCSLPTTGSFRSTGIVTMERIEALDEMLSLHEGECNIVCCHYALGTDARNSDWWIRDEFVDISGNARNGNRSALLSILGKHNVKIFLNGHEHNGSYPVYTINENTSIKNVNCGSLFDSFAIATVDKVNKTLTIEVYDSIKLEHKTTVQTIVLPYA